MQSVRTLTLVVSLALAASVSFFAACGGDGSGGAADGAGGGADGASDDVRLPGDAADVDEGDDTPEAPDGGSVDTPPVPCDGPCDDGDPCTTDDVCVDGVCQGAAKDCEDGDPCTTGTCRPADGECVHAPASGADCDDGDPCTADDVCTDGECGGTETACDDSNPCTADTCAPDTGVCSYEILSGAACEDNDQCTFNGTCNPEGVCIGAQVDCDDGVSCTNDVCTPEGECIHVPAKENCDDGLACTADWCDPAGDCRHTGVLALAPAQDGVLDEWPESGIVATNEIASTVLGGDLRSLSVSVSGGGLHLAIRGTAAASQAWIVALDTDFAARPEGTGVRDLSTLSGDALAVSGAADVRVDAFGFGAELAVIGTVGATGCRTLAVDGSATEAPCTIQANAADKSIEVTIPWSSLLGGDPPEGDPRLVAGVALLASIATGAPGNQFLPGQEPPVMDLFVVPVAGGVCLAPFCGNGVVEAGETCDDGNDDPLDECAGCAPPAPPGMVTVPGGEFIMGKDMERSDTPYHPAHAVWVDTFFIDRREVTTTEFAEFLDAHDFDVVANVLLDEEDHPLYQCSDRSSYVDCGFTGRFQVEPGFEDYPVGETSWWGAYRYCQWRGKRLPTEAEWEKAARGTDERKYPWGDERLTDVLNCEEFSCHDGFARAAPVELWPENASPYGALDMAGNVWEWVQDWYGQFYYSNSPYENPRGPCDGALTCPTATRRVARGGSWDDPMPTEQGELEGDQNRLTTWYRHWEASDACNEDVGFRCAMDGPTE